MTISRMEKLPLRDLWKHEAHDFTQWLSENLDFVSDTIGIKLTLIERESAAGPFSADILAEDEQGNPVIIENQLEQTNHDHLGKLITYMSNLDAKTSIWITSDPRPEHENAVHWLNEALPADTAFFLLKIEAFRINDSDPAPYLTIIAGPSSESKQVGFQKKELAETHVLRKEFWFQLLACLKPKTRLFERISPSDDNWITTSSGKNGFVYSFTVRMGDAQVELYIDRLDATENKKLFDNIYSKKDEIEKAFGATLDWQRLDDKRGCRVRHVVHEHGLADKENWPQLQEKLVDEMIRLYKAMQPIIQNIP